MSRPNKPVELFGTQRPQARRISGDPMKLVLTDRSTRAPRLNAQPVTSPSAAPQRADVVAQREAPHAP